MIFLFIGYATDYWHEHAQVGNVELQLKDALDCFFDVDKPHLAAWLRVNYFRGAEYSRSEEPLYVAATYGFSSLVERLIAKRPQGIDFCGQGGTPLHSSVLRGHIEVVKLLLAHGADINSRSGDNSTPLLFAASGGFLEVARILLEHNAEVNSSDDEDLPHFSEHQRMDTLMLCGYCWTTMLTCIPVPVDTLDALH